ncbi:hypothetical protein CMUS01_14288 [Colletotrichum musicola]|uniref:Uncharacterized protein n=1 Tax=Colletotrichum musicola TaxID=2175873 RepID=A0A8H6J601_9PEZI|nr:hypothetical protein CMUS01_14288 [Colletotrichum musicola]
MTVLEIPSSPTILSPPRPAMLGAKPEAESQLTRIEGEDYGA